MIGILVNDSSTGSRGGLGHESGPIGIIEQYGETLNELRHRWRESGEILLQWDSASKCFAGPGYRETYRALFGSLRLLRGWGSTRRGLNKSRKLLAPSRWWSSFVTDISLPRDAVLIPLRNGRGIVAASAREGIVIKVKRHGREIEKERLAFETAQAANIEQHLPAIIQHGVAADGTRWLVSELARNDHPIISPLNPFAPRGRWRKFRADKVIPMMTRFYDACGVEQVALGDLLDKERGIIETQAVPDYLSRLWEQVEASTKGAKDAVSIRTTLHGDLHASHLHTAGQRWWLVDWGSMRKGEVSSDFFRDRILHLSLRKRKEVPFWDWLRGNIDYAHVPQTIKDDVVLFTAILRKYYGLSLDAEAVRCFLLIEVISSIRRERRGNILRWNGDN